MKNKQKKQGPAKLINRARSAAGAGGRTPGKKQQTAPSGKLAKPGKTARKGGPFPSKNPPRNAGKGTGHRGEKGDSTDLSRKNFERASKELQHRAAGQGEAQAKKNRDSLAKEHKRLEKPGVKKSPSASKKNAKAKSNADSLRATARRTPSPRKGRRAQTHEAVHEVDNVNVSKAAESQGDGAQPPVESVDAPPPAARERVERAHARRR